ncbi:MAG: thioredoxin family protein [Clostridia bacterium]
MADIEKTEKTNRPRMTAMAKKIIIFVAIAVAVAGIYLVKNGHITFSKNDDSSAMVPTNTEIDAYWLESPEFDLDATEDFDLEEILSYGLPVMIDFGADSCDPCKAMAPVLKALNAELRGRAIVKFVDVWKNPSIAGNIPIRVIPTQFFFDSNGLPYIPSGKNLNFIKYLDRESGEMVFAAHEGGMTREEIMDVLRELGIE